MRNFPDFSAAIKDAQYVIRTFSTPIKTGFWQGMNISATPGAEMREVAYHAFEVSMKGTGLAYYREQIRPNLPWADDHFHERVSRQPLNPGKEWRHWPWSLSADRHRTQGDQFNHTYMERYWPKHAGQTEDQPPLQGIRNPLGDLDDLIELMRSDPLTRQAYLPVYFPEDTGLKDRKPCSLGYLFLMRNKKLDITYYIRSCDFMRHFRDDIYLTVRLLLWVLEELRQRDRNWAIIEPGVFRMDIGSLHLFVNDYQQLFGEKK